MAGFGLLFAEFELTILTGWLFFQPYKGSMILKIIISLIA